jgi:hypothetical protein
MRDLRGGLLVFATGVLLLGFATPARALWAHSRLGWWAPFLIWAIAILALVAADTGSDEGGRTGP